MEVIHRILKEQVDFGPCSAHLATEYDLFGPVIGKDRIDLIIREENIETDEMRFLQQVLASEEWKSEAGFISGYNLTRSGQISVPK